MAHSGWKPDEIARMPEDHILFAFHYLRKKEKEFWHNFGAHLGTEWETDDLREMLKKRGGALGTKKRVFVPLSLIVNPELPSALLGQKPQNAANAPSGTNVNQPQASQSGDGLSTGMPIPQDTEIVNMANLDKGEFFGLIANAGLQTKK